jgi:hypothetical protein
MHPPAGLLVLLAAPLALAYSAGFLAAADPPAFTARVVDAGGPPRPWAKIVADLDGDRLPDLIIAGQKGPLVWYRAPAWERFPIAGGGYSTVTGAAADINGDGHPDIVLGGTVWFENPGNLKTAPQTAWKMHRVAEDRTHDAIAADFNGDGRPDIATRNQSEFGYKAGDRVRVFLQTPGGGWQAEAIPCEHGEGIVAADVDRDGDPDIVLGGVWLETVREDSRVRWVPRRFASWHPNAAIAVGDMNGDGRPDIVLAPSELAKQQYRISWFEAPPDPKQGAWREHRVAEPVECVLHGIQAADIDLDGRPDIVFAEMHQGQDPDEVGVYYNRGGTWEKQVVATTGAHDIQIADLDRDGDIDLFGANWSGGDQAIRIWINGLR